MIIGLLLTIYLRYLLDLTQVLIPTIVLWCSACPNLFLGHHVLTASAHCYPTACWLIGAILLGNSHTRTGLESSLSTYQHCTTGIFHVCHWGCWVTILNTVGFNIGVNVKSLCDQTWNVDSSVEVDLYPWSRVISFWAPRIYTKDVEHQDFKRYCSVDGAQQTISETNHSFWGGYYFQPQ